MVKVAAHLKPGWIDQRCRHSWGQTSRQQLLQGSPDLRRYQARFGEKGDVMFQQRESRPSGLTGRSGRRGVPSLQSRSPFAYAFRRLRRVLGLLGVVLAVGLQAALPAEAVEGLRLQSLAPGQLKIEWDAPDPAPTDYRVNWGPADASFPSWRDSSGNAFLAGTALTLHDLETGVEYKVRVRARYAQGRNGRFSVAVVQRVDDYASDSETEGTVAVGGSASGRIDSSGDVDWFAVELTAEQGYDVTVQGEVTLGAQLIGMYNAFGTAAGEGVTWSGTTALVFTPGTGGVYHVSVAGTDEATGDYTVSVQERAAVAAPGSEPTPSPTSPSDAASTPEPTPKSVQAAARGLKAVPAKAVSQEEELGAAAPSAKLVWSRILKVTEVSYGASTPIAYHGFGAYSDQGGEPWSITLPNGEAMEVQALVVREGGTPLYWTTARRLSPALEGQLVLRLGRQAFRFVDARLIANTQRGQFYFWSEPGLSWRAGDEVAVALYYEARASSVELVEVARPDRVQAVEVTPGTEPGSVEVAWQAPANAAEARIDTYELYVQAVGGGWHRAQRHVVEGTTLRTTLRDLVPGGEYEVQVYAVNEVAISARAQGAGQAAAVPPDISEATGADLPASVATTGQLAVGGSVTGTITPVFDQDWFAVELTAGHTYRIDERGHSSGGGTLLDPVFFGIFDHTGTRIEDTVADDGGVDIDSRLIYRARYSGVHYLSAAGGGEEWTGTGTYTLEVRGLRTDDADGTRDGATELGNITDLETERQSEGRIGGVDWVDYYSFVLDSGMGVQFSLRGRGVRAILTVEDGDGEAVSSFEVDGSNAEVWNLSLVAGSYYLRVDATGSAANSYVLAYDVGPAEPAAPTGLGAAATSSQVSLIWIASADDSVAGYVILRGPDPDTLSEIGEVSGRTTTSYDDAELEAEATYVYAVRARNAYGVSATSVTISVTTAAGTGCGTCYQ